MSAAVHHPISQALIGLLHYIIEEEDEEGVEGGGQGRGGGREEGGTARKTLSTQ